MKPTGVDQAYTESEWYFLLLIRKAVDSGVTLEVVENVMTAIQDDDSVARLTEYLATETDPVQRNAYQVALSVVGGRQ